MGIKLRLDDIYLSGNTFNLFNVLDHKLGLVVGWIFARKKSLSDYQSNHHHQKHIIYHVASISNN